MTLKRLSAIALAISTALTLTACGGSEADTARGLANAPNPLVQPSNTGNSNTNTSNADAADAIDNTGAGTGTNTGTTTNPTAPNTTGNSTDTSQNRPVTVETGTLTKAFKLGDPQTIKPESIDFTADKTRNSLIQEMIVAYDSKDAYGNSRFETVAGYTAKIDSVDKRRNASFQAEQLGANQGYNDLKLTEVAHTNIDGKRYDGTREARVQLYRGEHSMVLGSQTLSGRLSDGTTTKTLGQGELVIDHIKGNPISVTDFADLTSRDSATFTYNGKAFSQNGVGDLNYTVDFVDQSGSGKITGLSDKGTINLNQASIGYMVHENYDSTNPPLTSYGIRGLAHFENGAKDGIYTLGFFGSEAEEIVGVVTEDGDKHTVGFGGKKQ